MQGHAYVLLYVDNNNYTEPPVKLLSCIIVLLHKGTNVNQKVLPYDTTSSLRFEFIV